MLLPAFSSVSALMSAWVLPVLLCLLSLIYTHLTTYALHSPLINFLPSRQNVSHSDKSLGPCELAFWVFSVSFPLFTYHYTLAQVLVFQSVSYDIWVPSWPLTFQGSFWGMHLLNNRSAVWNFLPLPGTCCLWWGFHPVGGLGRQVPTASLSQQRVLCRSQGLCKTLQTWDLNSIPKAMS